jgi:hypothetical protein
MDISAAREHGLFPAMPDGARLAVRVTAAIFDGRPWTSADDEEPGYVLAAVQWLGSVAGLAATANGTDPALLEVPGHGRGGILAREYLATGYVQVCCPHCGGLLMLSLACVTAALFTRLHGDKAAWQWQQLTDALAPEPGHPF